MPQCEGHNRDGTRCRRLLSHRGVCTQHAAQGLPGHVGWAAAGATIGHLIAPGPGGWVGAGVASVLRWLSRTERRKARVFVSFDFDEDQGLKHLLIGQARNSDCPFEVVDGSLKEAAPEKSWKAKARAAIEKSDLVLVLVGPHTHRAPGVLAEVAMARELGKPMVQLVQRGKSCRKVAGAGRAVTWTWPNLQALFSV